MDNFVLFCKTYCGDFERFCLLKQSVDEFNADKIPFYVSCPEKDKELFLSVPHDNSYRYEVIADEEILDRKNGDIKQNWLSQQVVKLAFYRKGLCNFYLLVDSDAYFVRNFYVSDFMHEENIPYIVMHENKSFQELCGILGDKNVFEYARGVKLFLDRKGKNYQFLPFPVFSCEVLRELEKNVAPAEDLIEKFPVEAIWHGEYLLKSRKIDFMPCEPFFKLYNYEHEYRLWKKLGETRKDIEKHYVGIIMQNRWVKHVRFEEGPLTFYYRRLLRLKHYIYADRGNSKKRPSYYIRYVKNFLKVLFGRQT